MSTVDALQTGLAAEHAAVYVLGVLGGQTSRSTRPALYAALQDAFTVHRDRRDQLVAMLRDLDAAPVPAEPAYELPAELGSVAAVTERARALEAGCASTYAFIVGSTTDRTRRWAVEALSDAAVRGLAFGAEPEVLPGT